ncbi:uncharacterized protein LOC144350857 [Saccoglossus kowalevskii]
MKLNQLKLKLQKDLYERYGETLILGGTISAVWSDTGGLTQSEFDHISDYVLNNDGTFMGNLADFINDVRSNIPVFDLFPVDVKASLVDAAVSNTLSTDVIDMINDESVTWTEACYTYVDVENFWNADNLGTEDLRLRMQLNCGVMFSYGLTTDMVDFEYHEYGDISSYNNYEYHRDDEDNSKYNPCSDNYKLMYPYGPKFDDKANVINDDGSSGEIPLSISFPFYGTSHTSLWVNTNGDISFIKEVSEFTPLPFPLGDDWLLVTPYWADIDTKRGGNVFWRETTDPRIVARAARDIAQADPCALLDSEIDWVFVATWDNAAFFDAFEDHSRALRNTFQVVLTSNGHQSFAIFNYVNIEWTTGMSSGGDEYGLGGTPAQVGFNVGDGVNFFSVPLSMQPEVVDIEETTNVDIQGRYVFQVDAQTIVEPNCEQVCNLYVVHTNEVDWSTAKTNCETDGGRLATLNTESIYNAVKKDIRVNGFDDEVRKGFWIGLNDRDNEGDFVWLDGSTLVEGDFAKWANGQPNNNSKLDNVNGQDCVQLWKKKKFQWDDEYCFRSKGYVCEIPC